MADEKKKAIELEIQEELNIDETKMDEELLHQPSRFFYWSTSWALANKKARHLKLQAEEIEARLSRQFREKMAEDDPKIRVTEKMLDDYVSEQAEYKTIRQDMIQADYMVDMLGVAKDAFRQRHQVMIELYKTSLEEKYYEGHGFDQMQKELEEKRGGRRGKKKME